MIDLLGTEAASGQVLDSMILQVRQLHKGYKYQDRHIDVLRGVDLDIRKGEIVAVIGKSGVGKSTLLHILGTLDRPDKGNVLFRGRDVFAMNEVERVRFRNRHLGFVFQFHHLLPEFTALENVMLPALIGGISRTKARERAMDLLETLGIAERAVHVPGTMSGGEQQRVALARALVMEPEIILADEPTGNLDVATSKEVNNLFVKVNEQFHTTFVLATHSPTLAVLAHRVYTLANGVLQEEERG